MKNLCLGILGITFMVCVVIAPAAAQDLRNNQVPSIVNNSFKKQFPQAVDIDWEMKKGLYEVEFEIKRLDHKILLNADGEIVSHKQELRARDLPEQVKKKVRSTYKGYKISEADQLTQQNRRIFKLELKSLLKELDIIVDAEGQVLEEYIW